MLNKILDRCALAFMIALLSSGVALAQEGPAEEVITGEVLKAKKSSWTDHIEVRGDLRYRVELIQKDSDNLQYRHRLRARPALHATVFDELSVVIGLGTGGASSSDGEGDLKSNNQTLAHGWSSKFIWLDQAYFDYHPTWLTGLRVLGGKMKNPLYRVGKSELLWDPDLNPEGLAFSFKNKFGIVEPFLTGISYVMENRKQQDDAWLLGTQLGLTLHFRGLTAKAGGRYMNYTNIKATPPIWDDTDTFGNSFTASDTDGDGTLDTFALANDFNIVGGFLELGGKLMGLPWAVFADYATNTAADKEQHAWLAGALLGSTKEQWGYKFRYIYRQIGADSVYGLVTDSDFFGGNAGGKGHEINAALALHRLVSFGATYFFNQGPVTDGADEFDYHRVQIDLKMKF